MNLQRNPTNSSTAESTINSAPSILIAESLCKNYEKVEAVKSLNLSLSPGKCLGLLGPNGAGKTTTCEMLCGLLPPSSGRVSILGMDYKSERHKILDKIGVHLQSPNLYKKNTVKETLALFASFYTDATDQNKLIHKLSLMEQENLRLEKLSEGQKQRVYLGCALINNPQLLILDEPTSSLDPHTRLMIWDLLLEQKKSGTGILLTTHNMHEAQALADEITILDKGSLLLNGKTNQLINKVCGKETLSFSFLKPQACEISQLKEDLPWLKESQQHGDEYFISTNDGRRFLNELTTKTQTNGIDLKNIELRSTTLEDVFIQLTGRGMRDD